MLLKVDHHSGVPIYRQLLDQIKQQVLSGRLEAGQRLESVRDVAGRLKVNPMTVSKVYSLLEREGFVERRRGVGIFVRKIGRNKRQVEGLEMLKDILGQAAFTAVQFDIAPEKTIEIFEQYYERMRKQKEGNEWEVLSR